MTFEEFSKEVQGLRKFAEGWRGIVYRGRWREEEVAVKVAKREEVRKAIQKEGEILERLRGVEGFPKLLVRGKDFVAYRFIEGIPLGKIEVSPQEERRIYRRLVELAYFLDSSGIRRDEFHRIEKNVLIGRRGEVYVLDFERGSFSDRPSNLTQLLQLLRRKGYLSKDETVSLGRKYIAGERQRVLEEVLSKLK
jgi:putative serine/threonine protein kinase